VRRCGSGNAFSNTCTIAAGGCDSAEQKADVRIQLTPAIAGIPVDIPTITGGQGVRVGSASNDAKIVLNDSYISYMEDETDGQYVTDAFGRVEGTYWGSNHLSLATGGDGYLTKVQIQYGAPSGGTTTGGAEIDQTWADTGDPARWAGPTYFEYEEPSPVVFLPKLEVGTRGAGPPIRAHTMCFSVTQANVYEQPPGDPEAAPSLVVYTTNGQWQEDPNMPAGAEVHVVPDLSTFAEIDPPVVSDSGGSGSYSASLTVHDVGPTDDVDFVDFDAADDNTW
jgi:type 1 fimbria pilin